MRVPGCGNKGGSLRDRNEYVVCLASQSGAGRWGLSCYGSIPRAHAVQFRNIAENTEFAGSGPCGGIELYAIQ